MPAFLVLFFLSSLADSLSTHSLPAVVYLTPRPVPPVQTCFRRGSCRRLHQVPVGSVELRYTGAFQPVLNKHCCPYFWSPLPSLLPHRLSPVYTPLLAVAQTYAPSSGAPCPLSPGVPWTPQYVKTLEATLWSSLKPWKTLSHLWAWNSLQHT